MVLLVKIILELPFSPLSDFLWGAGMAQWCERSPPTNVSWVWFPDPASYAGWVCCWFSSLLREVFLRVLRFSPLLKNQHIQIPIRSGIVKHFIMSHWLRWLCKHSLCLTLNLLFLFLTFYNYIGMLVTRADWPFEHLFRTIAKACLRDSRKWITKHLIQRIDHGTQKIEN